MSDQNLSPVQLASVLAQVEVSQQRLGAFASKATSQTMASTADLAGDMNKQAKEVQKLGTVLAIIGPAVTAIGGMFGSAAIFSDTLRSFIGGYGMAGIHVAQAIGLLATGGLGAVQDVYKSKVSLDQSAATTVQKSGQQIVKAAQTNQQTSANLARTEGDLVKSTDVKIN